MSVLRLSSRYRISIPRDLCQDLSLKPGQKMVCFTKNGIIYLLPSKPIQKLRGFIRGISNKNLRDKSDRI